MKLVRTLLPVTEWLPGYRRTTLRADALAGVTVSTVLIPQALAFALLMGVPPSVAIVATIVPLVAYFAFGSTPFLSVGPTSLVSLVTAVSLQPLAGGNQDLYLTLVAVTALMSGVFMVILGSARLGWLVSFLSNPVLTGFSAAVAVAIVISQIAALLGFSVTTQSSVIDMAKDTISGIADGDVQPVAFAIGAASLALLIVGRIVRRRWPWPLVAVALGSAVVALFDLDGVPVVGNVPRVFPLPNAPDLDVGTLKKIAAISVAVIIVSFVQGYAISRLYARAKRLTVDPNAELRAVGMANVVSALFGAFPVGGGPSQTAVNVESGARTQVASLIAAGCVLIVSLVFSPLLKTLPRAVLAAIIIVSERGLIDVREMRMVLRTRLTDFFLGIVAFVATLILGVIGGLAVAVLASLAEVIRRSVRPRIVLLGRVQGTTVYRERASYPDVEMVPGLALVRVDAPLYFANAAYVADSVRAIDEVEGEPVWAVVLDCRGMDDLDATGVQTLIELAEELEGHGVRVALTTLSAEVREIMQRGGLVEAFGETHLFLNNDAAVRHLVEVHRAGRDQKG